MTEGQKNFYLNVIDLAGQESSAILEDKEQLKVSNDISDSSLNLRKKFKDLAKGFASRDFDGHPVCEMKFGKLFFNGY